MPLHTDNRRPTCSILTGQNQAPLQGATPLPPTYPCTPYTIIIPEMSRQPTSTPPMRATRSKGGEAEGEEKESYPRELGKKFLDSAAEEAGSQTVDYVKENMQPMLDDAQGQIDDAKEQALAEIQAAKEKAQAAKEQAQAEMDEKKQQAQDQLNATKVRAQQELEDVQQNFMSKIFGCSETGRPEQKREDSLMKTVGKKYAGGVASKAGGQTEEYIKDHHEELQSEAADQYDATKARAQAELDEAKQTWSKIFPCCG
ncbi:hypothetical protein B0H10DRAFT_2436369 [Mycena sp. CBHHK59/15]|nr:hypothetical protein B0H10DRAFT_2436369 [Mycena sp. CBHHK59/15]